MTRRFPAQGAAESLRIDRHEQQLTLPSEVTRRGLRTWSAGEVDEAVGDIDRRAGEDAGRLRGSQRLRHDLEDQAQQATAPIDHQMDQ